MVPRTANITVVAQKNPCTACVIIGGMINETLDEIGARYPFLTIERVELENVGDMHSIEGLEVERFPAVLVNGEQITAGSFLSVRQLENILSGNGVQT